MIIHMKNEYTLNTDIMMMSQPVMCLDNFAGGGGGGVVQKKSDQLYFFDRLFLQRKFINNEIYDHIHT